MPRMIIGKPEQDATRNRSVALNESGSKSGWTAKKTVQTAGMIAARRRKRLSGAAEEASCTSSPSPTTSSTCTRTGWATRTNTPPRLDKQASDTDSVTIETLPETPSNAERSRPQSQLIVTPLTELTDKDRVFVYNPEGNSLQDESSLADLSTIAGSLESLDGTYLEIPEEDNTTWADEKDYPFTIVGAFLEKRDDPEKIFANAASGDTSILPAAAAQISKPTIHPTGALPSEDIHTCRNPSCCVPFVAGVHKEVPTFHMLGASTSCPDPANAHNACCMTTGPKHEKTAKKQVAFGAEVIRVFERSKEEIGQMMEHYSNVTTSTPSDDLVDLEEELGRYITETANDLASKCEDPIPTTCIILPQSESAEEEVEMREWDTSSFHEVDASSIFSQMHKSPVEPESEDHALPKANHEKWNQLVAHLEKERLGVDDNASCDELGGDRKSKRSEIDQNRHLFRWRQILKSVESGKTEVQNFVGEMQCLLSKAEDGFNRLSVQVGSTLACTANVPDELIRCFDGQSQPGEWAEPLAAETKVWLDRSWLSMHENNSADSINKLAIPNELSNMVDPTRTLRLNPTLEKEKGL